MLHLLLGREIMRRIISVLLLVTTPLFVRSAQAQEETYMAPKTEWGQPDLQGVWNFSSNVPIPVSYTHLRAHDTLR